MGYNIYFDGSDDYLIANANSGSFGTADFTIEAFVKVAVSGGNRAVMNNYNTYNANSLGIFCTMTTNGYPDKYSVALGSSGFPNIVGSVRPSSKSYDHIALTRQGNTITLYVNGNRDGTACTFTGNLTHSSGNTWIGTDGSSTGSVFKGWMKGFRIIKKECLYTANFSPPTILTLTANTTLLTCNSLSLNANNKCQDQSNLGYSIITVGDVGVAGDGIDFVSRVANSSTLISYSVGEEKNLPNTSETFLFSSLYNWNEYIGNGKIFGTVKKRISKQNIPVSDAKVSLFTQNTKVVLKETTSNTTGHFLFDNININEKYYVTAFDPVLQENAVIADNITPERM